MIDPVTITLIGAALREGVIGVVRLIQVMQANKQLTEEEARELIERIKSDAAASDDEWDAAVSRAKGRLGDIEP